MPRRPRSHVVGDIAVSRVLAICNELGWACEAIQKDYGEDLWVQTTIGEMVDHHRIWFQVKGTDNLKRYQNARGVISYVVDSEHALRWVRNLELVVVILWDLKTDTGYWTLPKDSLIDWDLWAQAGKTARLVFKKRDKFNSTSADLLSQIARIDFYNNLLAIAQQTTTQYEREAKMGLPVPKYPDKRVNLVCYDFLRSIGFFDKDGRLNDQIGTEIVDEISRQLDRKPRQSDGQLCIMAVTIVVLRHSGKGSLPGPLLFATVRFYASHMLSQLEEHGLKNLDRLSREKQS